MRRRHALLVAFLLALPALAHSQAVVSFGFDRVDHNWIIHYGTNTYGLVQHSTYFTLQNSPQRIDPTQTIVNLGPRAFVLHTSVWPIVAGLVAALAILSWLAIYGINSLAKPREKPP
jgi:hypothetical protein